MGKINLLEKSVYTRIAAGEVVERPASVVKELVENAVDAKAKHIEILVYNGGKDLIQVTDDGSGIEKDDLIKAVMPHATSKIKTLNDINMILTLGFRGEALASIASVSVLTIVSKTEGAESGYKIVAKDDTVTEPKPAPSEVGTTISVERLFLNVPVREKFLKSSAQEESEITTLVKRLIFANSNIAFTYIVDGKTVFKTDGLGVESAFLDLFSYNDFINCIKIDEFKNGMRLFGFIGKPSYTKPNKTYQTVIINSRYVVNGTISSAIHSAYAPFLMKHQFPFYQIHLDIAPQFVDVNVHPNKTEVRFMDNQTIYATIFSMIKNVLSAYRDAGPIFDRNDDFQISDAKERNSEQITEQNTEQSTEQSTEYTTRSKPSKKTDPDDPYSDFDLEKRAFFLNGKFNPNSQEDISHLLSKVSDDEYEEPFTNLYDNHTALNAINSGNQSAFGDEVHMPAIIDFTVIGQALNTYIILERGEDLIFIDQHAAHERLLYDNFKTSLTTGDIETQGMIEPFIFKVNEEEINFLTDKLIPMRKMGFDICDYDDDEFAIYGIPSIVESMNLQDFVDELLSDTAMRTDIPDVVNNKIATMACKAAIKSGKNLKESEIYALLKEIDGNFALKCPHGRPIAVKVTRKQIDKWFKRIL